MRQDARFRPCFGAPTSVMKPVVQLHHHLARVVPVEATEGQAVVQFKPAIGQVESGHGGRPAFSEALAQGQIKGGVPGRIGAGIGLSRNAVREARALVNIGRSPGAPRQIHVAAEVERIALIVIEGSERGVTGEIGKPAGDAAAALGNLVGGSQVELRDGRDGASARQVPSRESRLVKW